MAVVMTCAASCASEPDPGVLESSEELSFDATEAPASRASVSTNKNLTKKPFMIYGDVNRIGEFYSGLKVIFNGAKVTYKNNKWAYETPIYWLIGQEHSFVAIHPADIQEIPVGGITYSDSKVSFTYETPVSNYKATTDILVATHRRKYTLDTTGAVKFGLKHILTRLNIEPALEDSLMYADEENKELHPYNQNEYIEIHRIELYGLKTRASFSFAPVPLQDGEVQTDECIETYEVDDNSVKPIFLNFPDKTPKVTNNQKNVNVFDDDNVLLLLPQDISDNVKVILYYTINGDHTEHPLIRTVSLPLSGIGKWEAGKSNTYRFTIQKAYTGQIKPGTLRWEVNDITLPEDSKDNWIDEDEPIIQEFDVDDD